MKAFSITGIKQVTQIDVAEPIVGPNDVCVEVHYIGLCGSDLNTYRGLMPLVTLPRIPGHEISGIVIKKGENVNDKIKIGDKVTVLPYTNCNSCAACKAGRPNACKYNETLGVQRDGALTSLITVPDNKIFISHSLSLKELVLVEPLSVGYHATNRAKITNSDTVLIIGCGAIGTGALIASAHKKATVIAMDVDDSKLHLANKFGAQYLINTSKVDALNMINQITQNVGVNVVVEAAGNQQTYDIAFNTISYAGRIVFIGYPKNKVSIDAALMIKKELNVYGSRNALNVFPSVIEMLEKKDKPYEDIITKVFPFEKTPEAFDYWDKNAATVTKILIELKK